MGSLRTAINLFLNHQWCLTKDPYSEEALEGRNTDAD